MANRPFVKRPPLPRRFVDDPHSADPESGVFLQGGKARLRRVGLLHSIVVMWERRRWFEVHPLRRNAGGATA